MPRLQSTASVRLALVLVLGGLSLSACATKAYVNDEIAAVNGRVDAVDAKAQDARQRADAAAAAAQAAATDAQGANQRLDQLTGRVEHLEQMPAKRARN